MTINNHLKNVKKWKEGRKNSELYNRALTPSFRQRGYRYCLKLLSQINRSIAISRASEKTARSKSETVFKPASLP